MSLVFLPIQLPYVYVFLVVAYELFTFKEIIDRYIFIVFLFFNDFPLFFSFFKDFIYLFLQRGEEREKRGRETPMCG